MATPEFNKLNEELLALTKEVKARDREIEDKEQQIADLKAEVKKLREEIIPEVMDEAGQSRVTLLNGTEIEVKPFYFARAPQNEEGYSPLPFYDWCDEHGHGGLVKTHLEIFTSDYETVKLVREFSQMFQIQVEEGRGIHWKTLESWFREQYEAHKPLPLTLFKNYVGRTTKIK